MHGAAAEDVEVEVVDGLAAVGAGVGYDAVAAGEQAVGECGSGVGEVAEDFDGRFGDVGEVLLGNEENVGGGLGVDVGESYGLVVLVDGLDWDLVGGDFAEEAVGHGENPQKSVG